MSPDASAKMSTATASEEQHQTLQLPNQRGSINGRNELRLEQKQNEDVTGAQENAPLPVESHACSPGVPVLSRNKDQQRSGKLCFLSARL